jgi:predicted transcriptional regulator
MLALYLGGLLLLALVWSVVPLDCGFLPTATVIEPPWFGLLLCVFFFSAAFFGGILQLYNLTDRGFSLRILIDCLETPGGALGVDRLLKGYSGGRGMQWMYDKRIAGMLESGLVVAADDKIVLTAAGRRLAERFARLRQFLKMGPVAR